MLQLIDTGAEKNHPKEVLEYKIPRKEGAKKGG